MFATRGQTGHGWSSSIVPRPTWSVWWRCSTTPYRASLRLGDIWLTPAFQRTHAATDAVLSLLSHLLGRAAATAVWSGTATGRDKRGRKAAERYGFLLEGILRKHRVDSRGCNVDTALYALTNSDWRDDGVKNALEKKLRPPSSMVYASTRPVALSPPSITKLTSKITSAWCFNLGSGFWALSALGLLLNQFFRTTVIWVWVTLGVLYHISTRV